MIRVCFTQTLARHLPVRTWEVPGDTVGQALDAVFSEQPALRGYVLNDQGAVRHHVAVFVDGSSIKDRRTLSDPVPPGAEVQVLQALSGG